MSFPDPDPESTSLKGRIPDFFPPRVVWAREMGWINVRDQWGQWHSIEARDAPRSWLDLLRLARKARTR